MPETGENGVGGKVAVMPSEHDAPEEIGPEPSEGISLARLASMQRAISSPPTVALLPQSPEEVGASSTTPLPAAAQPLPQRQLSGWAAALLVGWIAVPGVFTGVLCVMAWRMPRPAPPSTPAKQGYTDADFEHAVNERVQAAVQAERARLCICPPACDAKSSRKRGR